MEQTDFSGHRVLILGAKTHGVQILRSVLGVAGISQMIHVEDSRRAAELLTTEHFNAVFCELSLEAEGEFVTAARRRDGMLNPMIPIFVMQKQARRRTVAQARDKGATDVLTTPVSPRTVAAKLKAALHSPRPFIVSQEFFGPDRRAKGRPTFFGTDRRVRAPKKTKMDFYPV
jgi:two-component system chemotaxis response regulator CheY